MSETFSDHFFEPNRPPEDVLRVRAKDDRMVRIRFKTREDAVAFTARTGIAILPGNANRVSYPLGGTLDEFF